MQRHYILIVLRDPPIKYNLPRLTAEISQTKNMEQTLYQTSMPCSAKICKPEIASSMIMW